ncbi:MAG: hypothetical protein KBF37_11965 [Saprospiraceae bacterium]|nr:hypothetical protein [Saprospiraceae bacterium]MBP9211024.1 hypothetical protein [Saprospiraceae bacterium]MBV6473128.1 hypothetical protein [Saprospiraceae bacterium]
MKLTQIVFATLLFSILSTKWTFAQSEAEKWMRNWEARADLERIEDVYIPKDLAEAMSELDRLTDDSMAAVIALAPEGEIASKLHFSLGRWMQLHWGLEEGSRLAAYLRSRGLSFPDDMIDLLIRCWHRHLNGKPTEEEGLITKYQERRRLEHRKRLEKTERIVLPPRDKR